MKNIATKNKLLLLALLTTLLALGVHGYLSLHFYDIKYGVSGEASVCNINEVLNCDAVAASQYSSLFGIPVALWGFAANLVLLYFIAVTRFNLVQDPDKTSRYALMLSGATVLASVVMGVISTQMSNLCLFCMIAHVLALIGFIALYLGATKASAQNLREDFKDIFVTEKWVLGFLIVIPAFAFLANLMYLESRGFAQVDKLIKERIAYWQVAPAHQFDLSAGLTLQKGEAEPVMTIVEFADFRCPHCKHASPPIHAFLKSHGDVRLVFKPFPLDSTCNEGLQSGDGISCGLAAAVMCAEKSAQKGWAAHDFFFDKQDEIISLRNLEKNLDDVAQHLALDVAQLKACVKDPATTESLRSMAREGLKAQIQGTPAIFVNGKLLTGGQMMPVLESAYRTLKK